MPKTSTESVLLKKKKKVVRGGAVFFKNVKEILSGNVPGYRRLSRKNDYMQHRKKKTVLFTCT